MIAQSVEDIIVDDVYLELSDLLPGRDLFLKLEGLNPAGSIKLKTANAIVEDAEQRGVLREGGRVIESSSGNLGISLSMVCASKGYQFTCVTDLNSSPQSVAAMRALGAEVIVVDQRDQNNGFLGARIALIHRLLAANPGLVWPNQYANPANPQVHWERTAAAIFNELEPVDYLFVGAGTTGTLMGCTAFFKRFSPRTQVVAVDAEGSVTFGAEPGPRHIPGLGTSRRPEICRISEVGEVVFVGERDTIAMCRWLARNRGLLAGGSTGSVLAAVLRSSDTIDFGARVVAISPDMGNHYLQTVYDDDWVTARFGTDVVGAEPLEVELVGVGEGGRCFRST